MALLATRPWVEVATIPKHQHTQRHGTRTATPMAGRSLGGLGGCVSFHNPISVLAYHTISPQRHET